MSFCVRDKRTGEYWRSGGGKTAWGTGTAAKQAYAARHRDRLDDSKTHELVDMTQVGLEPYKALLAQWLDLSENMDRMTTEQFQLCNETKYLLGLEPRPETI